MSSTSGSSFHAPVRESRDSLVDAWGGACNHRSIAVLENRHSEPIRRPGRPRGPTMRTTSASGTRKYAAASARVSTSDHSVGRSGGGSLLDVALVAVALFEPVASFVLDRGIELRSWIFCWAFSCFAILSRFIILF